MRSLADDIRSRSDDDLRRLLLGRPDLARPAPADLTTLAARATTRASAQRAVDHLDLAHVQVLEAVAVAGSPTSAERLLDLIPDGTQARIAEVLEDLWRLALLWGGPDGLHLVRTVGEVLGPRVAGLAPATDDRRPRGSTREVLQCAPEAAATVAERLVWGPPVASRPEEPSGAAGRAVAWLLEHGLLADLDEEHVAMPREIALDLRSGRLHRETILDEPPLRGTERTEADVDAAAGAQVSDLLTLVDELASSWGPTPPRVLRSGGLAVRDLAALSTSLDVDLHRAAFIAEVAWGARLVDDDGGLEPVWAPTPGYDDWQHRPGSSQWVDLARAWLASPRAAHLVTGRSGGDRVNALGPDVHWPPIRSIRLDVLRLLADAPNGLAPTIESLHEALRFRRPRRLPDDVAEVIRAVLTETEWMGVTGRGALSGAGRLLVADAPAEELAGAMHPHLPTPVDRVLLQADLTAIAPGPLVGPLAQFMRLVADIESRGGATVYRFSEPTVRRCLDGGWTADQVLDALRDASDTPVPQPLDYLVRDVARRHGQTRVGSVTTYVRSDDEAGLGELLATRSLAPLQLRRIAPTVLVSPAPAATVLQVLREHNVAPVVESPGGGVVVPEAQHRRATVRPRSGEAVVHGVDPAVIDTLVAALRVGEESAAHDARRRATRPGPDLPSTDPTTSLALLREAAADRQAVWVGYANGVGEATRMLFYPDRVEGGRVHGRADGASRTLSVHRITGVASD